MDSYNSMSNVFTKLNIPLNLSLIKKQVKFYLLV